MFTKEYLNNLNSDFKKIIEKFAKDNNIEVEFNGGIFDSYSFSPKIQFKTKDKNGKTKEEVDFELMAPLENLKPEWLNSSFVSNGITYTIIGYNRRKQKNPIILKASNGKQYTSNSDMIRFYMNKS